MIRISLFGLAVLASAPGIASADVYWSKDASGSVVLSDTPPDNATDVSKVTLPPAPSDEAVKEAEERAKRIQRQAELFAKDREARTEARARQKQEAAPAAETGDATAEGGSSTSPAEPSRPDSSRAGVQPVSRLPATAPLPAAGR